MGAWLGGGWLGAGRFGGLIKPGWGCGPGQCSWAGILEAWAQTACVAPIPWPVAMLPWPGGRAALCYRLPFILNCTPHGARWQPEGRVVVPASGPSRHPATPHHRACLRGTSRIRARSRPRTNPRPPPPRSHRAWAGPRLQSPPRLAQPLPLLYPPSSPPPPLPARLFARRTSRRPTTESC